MSDVRYFMEEIDVSAVIVAVFAAVGFGFFVVAAVMAWERLKKKYDPVFDPENVELDEKALRRMMKQTSKEMDWTKVRWG